MAKKIIFFLFIFFFLFFFNLKSVFGQINNPLLKQCGIANTEFNKCCVRENQKPPINIPVPTIDVRSIVEEKLNQYGFGGLMGECLLGKPDYSSGECICVSQEEPTPVEGYKNLCKNYFKDKPKDQEFCLKCVEGGGYYSGLGCVPINLANFISDFLLGRLIGLAGILAFFCIIYASFMMQSSQGNQEKLKKAQELLTSCIMGLIFIIFSVFILKLIGVDILKIPGLK